MSCARGEQRRESDDETCIFFFFFYLFGGLFTGELTGNMYKNRVEKTTELLKKHEEAKSLLYSLDALARFWRAL